MSSTSTPGEPDPVRFDASSASDGLAAPPAGSVPETLHPALPTPALPTPELPTLPDAPPAAEGLDRPRVERLRDRHGSDSVEASDAFPARTVGEAFDRDPTPRRGSAVPDEVLAADADWTPVDPTPTGHAAVVRQRRWRRVARGLSLLALAASIYYLVSLYQVWSVGRADQLEPVDAIVVMGAAQYDGRPSPQLAARLDHVVELWPEGYAPLVVVTGGNLPGDRFTEASASADYLVERGVPAEAILQEDEGSNSFESLDSVADILEARGLDEILIVTDPYHALRSREIAEEVGMTARVSSTDTSVVTGSDSFGRHVQEAAGVAVGRIIGFERLTNLVD